MLSKEVVMKNILFVVVIVLFSACVSPTKSNDSSGDTLPVYVPPHYDGVKEVNVLRPPSGYAKSVYRGLMAQSDPLIGECIEPGTVYMFFSEGALVQYVPNDGNYTAFSLAAKGDVERHNYQEPEDPWDIVTVSAPGFVYDLSHDPDPIVLRIRFLNNDGTDHLFSGIEVNMVASDPAEYVTWVNADGSPNANTRQTFGLWGAEDGHSVIHMQLGGDGVSIPAMTYHN